jgi:hypothetical protein
MTKPCEHDKRTIDDITKNSEWNKLSKPEQMIVMWNSGKAEGIREALASLKNKHQCWDGCPCQKDDTELIKKKQQLLEKKNGV